MKTHFNMSEKQLVELLRSFTAHGKRGAEIHPNLIGHSVMTGGRRIRDFHDNDMRLVLVEDTVDPTVVRVEQIADIGSFELHLQCGAVIAGYRLSPYTGFTTSMYWRGQAKNDAVMQEETMAA